MFDRGTPIYYINNRRVRNTAELTDLLPSNIKNVEVITSPGVQYPAGTGAVIRITIHRPQGEGWSGTFNEWASIDYELTTQTSTTGMADSISSAVPASMPPTAKAHRALR